MKSLIFCLYFLLALDLLLHLFQTLLIGWIDVFITVAVN